MNINSLEGISPIDRRYRSKLALWSAYFSEKALIQYRVKIEVHYFITLCQSGILPLPPLANSKSSELEMVHENFDLSDAMTIKEIEKKTNHDVKAVEYFLKEALDGMGLSDYKVRLVTRLQWVHWLVLCQVFRNGGLNRLIECYACQELFIESWPCHPI